MIGWSSPFGKHFDILHKVKNMPTLWYNPTHIIYPIETHTVVLKTQEWSGHFGLWEWSIENNPHVIHKRINRIYSYDIPCIYKNDYNFVQYNRLNTI